ncbi:hypothetical protein B0H11DRAFT_2285876 [Mycena galericulata]|nr:hypothetical protein B0H11DRAFT_2285876 [Mycena galericulata]
MVPHPRPLSFSVHHPAPRLSHLIPAAAANNDDKQHDDGVAHMPGSLSDIELASTPHIQALAAHVGQPVLLWFSRTNFDALSLYSTPPSRTSSAKWSWRMRDVPRAHPRIRSIPRPLVRLRTAGILSLSMWEGGLWAGSSSGA